MVPQIEYIPLMPQQAIFIAFCLFSTACGSLSDAVPTSDDSKNPYSENTGSTEAIQPRAGKYSFNTGSVRGDCSDGSGGVSPSQSLQFNVSMSGGLITLVQSAASSSSSTEKVSSSGMRIISSSPVSGNLSSGGSFLATGTSIFEDFKYGIIRSTYTVEGQFSGSSWSGSYNYTADFSAQYVFCRFSTTFTGFLVL